MRARKTMRLAKIIGAVLMSTMLCATPVGAQQPVDDQLRATARSLADEGMSFYEKKQYAEALDRFDRAAAIIQAPTITLHAARSLDKLGRLVEAAERYRACINTQLEDKAPEAFRSAQEAARSELQSLTPRIPSIEIVVNGPDARTAIVTLDGKQVPKALIGVKTLLNPGDHKIGASTDTHAGTEEVTILEKQHARVVVELQPKTSSNTGQTDPVIPEQPVKKPMNPKKVAGFITLGVGGALGIVGVAAGITALNDQESLNAVCTSGAEYPPGHQCLSDAFKKRVSSFETVRAVSIVGFALGGVALATGTVLVVLGSRSKPASDTTTSPTGSVHIEPWVGLNSAGLRGTF
jgi:hypothetical protein